MVSSRKKIIFYSKDINLGYSFLLYLQNIYDVTVTTDLNVIKMLTQNSDVDLIIIDSDPDKEIESFCENLKFTNTKLPVIIFYVYKDNIKELDSSIRKYVDSIFYKPYDFNEVSKLVSSLTMS